VVVGTDCIGSCKSTSTNGMQSVPNTTKCELKFHLWQGILDTKKNLMVTLADFGYPN